MRIRRIRARPRTQHRAGQRGQTAPCFILLGALGLRRSAGSRPDRLLAEVRRARELAWLHLCEGDGRLERVDPHGRALPALQYDLGGRRDLPHAVDPDAPVRPVELALEVPGGREREPALPVTPNCEAIWIADMPGRIWASGGAPAGGAVGGCGAGVAA